MKKKLNVAVLIGGPSAEREISLKTGAVVLRSLNPERYNALPVTITKEGKWLLLERGRKFVQSPGSRSLALRSGAALDRMKSQKIDVAFIAMHGTYGEDGTVQGLLEAVGIPYTGSGVLASALAMDKVKSAEIYAFHGLTIPRYVSFSKVKWQEEREKILSATAASFALPLVVKPRSQGSSVGVSIVRDRKSLAGAVRHAFLHDRDVMIQEYIAGTEVTCAVLDDGKKPPFPLSPTQIIPKVSDFFDYRAKYAEGGSDEITPARLPQPLIKEIQALAVKAHTVLECSGMSRTDMIVTSDLPTGQAGKRQVTRKEKIYILETNTIPGMTEASLLPKAAKAAGISFPELLDQIIAAGLRHSARA